MSHLTRLSTVVHLDVTYDSDPVLAVASVGLMLIGCVLVIVGLVRWLRVTGNVDRVSRRLLWVGGPVTALGAAWYAWMTYL
jgi:hypothetical protein